MPKVTKINIWQAIQRLDRLVFTTREIAALTGMSLSSSSQALRRLEEKNILKNILHGTWGVVSDKRFTPYMVVNFLSPSHQSYVSFISALHIHGMISQIPQTITVASTAHTKKMITPVGVYTLHQIASDFFNGFDWHESYHFLIAAPEKALVDCLYIASRRGRQYDTFPELEFPKKFNKSRAIKWAESIKDSNLRQAVVKKIESLMR